MAFQIPNWLKKAPPLNPNIPDMSAVFSRYEDQSPLQSAFNQGQMPQAQFGRLQTPANPTIEGAPVAEIPKLEPMPIGHGSWFNRKEAPASLQTWLKKQAEDEVKQAREQKTIFVLIANNPTKFIGRPPESFGSLKDAEAYLKLQIVVGQKDIALKEKERSNKAKEATAAIKKSDGYGFSKSTGTVIGGGVAPVGGGKVQMRAPNGVIGLVNPADVMRLKSKGYSTI